MLKIDDKVFLNIQEAVGWLMENNCIPFQCTAPYAANTEIGLGTIVNPSPAKVRIGSIIFFSDSNIATVTALTANGFMVGAEHNNIADDLVYVSNVAINASGHLIVTLSDGQTIDAGNVKQVSSFSINGSQHLIAAFNDGTTQDLGAIFTGNINISGNINATGSVTAGSVAADSIIENMSGYSMVAGVPTGYSKSEVYGGVVKNGNKLTLVYACTIIMSSTLPTGTQYLCTIHVPVSVGSKLHVVAGALTVAVNPVCALSVDFSTPTVNITGNCLKPANDGVVISVSNADLNTLVVGKEYYLRFEYTFLLSDSLV